jgi:hypothetical protein
MMVIGAAWSAILGGASIPMTIVDLPAWHTIGAVAYTQYARVTDMGPGEFLYPPLAIGGAILICATFFLAWKVAARQRFKIWLGIAAASSVLVLLMTLGAAPNLLKAGSSTDDPAVLAPLLERFDFWSVPRTVFLVATFWAMLLATAAFRRSRPRAD